VTGAIELVERSLEVASGPQDQDVKSTSPRPMSAAQWWASWEEEGQWPSILRGQVVDPEGLVLPDGIETRSLIGFVLDGVDLTRSVVSGRRGGHLSTCTLAGAWSPVSPACPATCA
jgi:hypothetical protein